MENDKAAIKIVLGATCFADAKVAIDIVEKLARTLQMQIRAYLLKDDAALYASALPFARAISPSGVSLEVSDAKMQQAYFADIGFYERALKSLAEQSKISWTLEERKGDLDGIMEAATSHEAIALFGFNQLQKPRNGIVVLAGEDQDISNFKSLAVTLSSEMNASIEVLRVETNENNRSNMIDLLHKLQTKSPALLIATSEIIRITGINALLDASRCPLIVYNQFEFAADSG